VPESDRPPVLLWAGLDRDLSPEIEAAICEVFPGDPERVHLATVRVMEVSCPGACIGPHRGYELVPAL
jgi:hypothetical protein